jgi:hypothetical protein
MSRGSVDLMMFTRIVSVRAVAAHPALVVCGAVSAIYIPALPQWISSVAWLGWIAALAIYFEAYE